MIRIWIAYICGIIAISYDYRAFGFGLLALSFVFTLRLIDVNRINDEKERNIHRNKPGI